MMYFSRLGVTSTAASHNDHPAVCTDIMEGAAEAGRTGKVAPMSKTG